MNCPYLDCSHPNLPLGGESCPTCIRLVKSCSECSTPNRAFANVCRSCGKPLPEHASDWISFKGSSQRLGLNRQQPNKPFREMQLQQVRELQLGDRCRSILSYDRHLFAVSQNGTIEIVDIARETSETKRVLVEGPITCEPCVHRGTLFVGSQGRVTAYPLARLTSPTSRLEPRWQVRLSGTPVQALLAIESHLYVTVMSPEGWRQVQVIDGIDRDEPWESRLLHTAQRLSWLAANPPTKRVFFLSEEGEDLWVHSIDHSLPPSLKPASRVIPGARPPLADNVPIAAMGNKIFAVLGENDDLCRIDAQDAVFDLKLRGDAKSFSMNGFNDGVLVRTDGLFFLSANVKDDVNPLERIKGSPVILRGSAAAVGTQTGKIRVYDLQNPPYYREVRLADDPSEEVTALASFRSYIAAGSLRGIVKIFSLA